MKSTNVWLLVIANVVLLATAQATKPPAVDASGWPFDKKCCEVSAEGTCVCVHACLTTKCPNSTQCQVERVCGDIE